jgi:hypothetical protein
LNGQVAPLQPVIDTLLAKAPASRFATAQDAAQALRQVADSVRAA